MRYSVGKMTINSILSASSSRSVYCRPLIQLSTITKRFERRNLKTVTQIFTILSSSVIAQRRTPTRAVGILDVAFRTTIKILKIQQQDFLIAQNNNGIADFTPHFHENKFSNFFPTRVLASHSTRTPDIKLLPKTASKFARSFAES
jgi:hypothetical protein